MITTARGRLGEEGAIQLPLTRIGFSQTIWLKPIIYFIVQIEATGKTVSRILPVQMKFLLYARWRNSLTAKEPVIIIETPMDKQ